MDEKLYLQLGRIYREHGVKAFCKFYSFSQSDDNLRLEQGYILKNVDGTEEKVKILQILPHKQFFLLLFDCFKTPESIVPWRKATLWMAKKDLKKEDNAIYDYEWEGFTLFDQKGQKVGIIQRIQSMPMKQFVVSTADREFFIPFVQEWVVRINKTKKEVVMNLPEGLY